MKKTLLAIIAIALMAFTAKADDSGQCGDNLTWSYESSTKTLTISGTGDMWDNPNFNNCIIATVIIEDGVTSIGAKAFYYNANLTSASIPNTMVSIGDNAFNHCDYLTSISIPDSVTTIGECAFNATSLESLTLGNSLSSIGEGAFAGCNIKTVSIPNSLKTISAGAFYSCRQLETIDFGDSLVAIDHEAFYFCFALKTLSFPNTLQTIGDLAFWDCYSLESVEFSESLEYIGDSAFEFCVVLKSVYFPELLSQANIEDEAFYNCSILELNCMSSTPPNCLGGDVFDIIQYANATLYVPIGCKSLYMNAPVWKEFINIVETGDSAEEMQDVEISVYPNPASDFLNVACENLKSLEIITIDGKVMKEQSATGSSTNVDISALPSGIYIVRVVTEHGALTKEIVKM